jgi:transcriptional regulator GlxA family with amidase domain
MATATHDPVFKVALLMFDGVDVLDFAGPLEIFSHASFKEKTGHGSPVFDFDFIAQSEVIRTSTQLRVLRDISLEEATTKLKSYDILLVPGGAPDVITPLWKSESPELQIVRDFGSIGQLPGKQPKILFSVCTGSLLLGRAGLLTDMAATSHHMFLDDLREACKLSGASGTRVVNERYVDSGARKMGMRIVTAGGVSSGLDAACHLVSTEFSHERALLVAKLAEYEWRRPITKSMAVI